MSARRDPRWRRKRARSYRFRTVELDASSVRPPLVRDCEHALDLAAFPVRRPNRKEISHVR